MQTQTQTKTAKDKAAKKATATNTNADKLKVAFARIERECFNLTFHETKLGRTANSFSGRFMQNLANEISKVESTKNKIVRTSVIYKDFLNPKNYDGDKVLGVLVNRLSVRRLDNRCRLLQKQYGCEFSHRDAIKVIQIVSNKLLKAMLSK